MTTPGLHRRQALTGVAGLGLGLPVLAACGGDSVDTAAEPTPTASGGATGGGDGGAGDNRGGGGGFASTSEVPVGGGTIFEDEKVVVTQATEGEFQAFSVVCTHQGCPVGRVEGDQIQCPCHGSAFSIADGSVITGPATAPLESVGITVSGGSISLG